MSATQAVEQADAVALLQRLCKLTHLSVGACAGAGRSAGSATPLCLFTQIEAGYKLKAMHNGWCQRTGMPCCSAQHRWAETIS